MVNLHSNSVTLPFFLSLSLSVFTVACLKGHITGLAPYPIALDLVMTSGGGLYMSKSINTAMKKYPPEFKMMEKKTKKKVLKV